MDDVALRCRCGNVGLCVREPLTEVDLHQLPQAVPLGLHQRLGVADLISVFHRVPELVRASERLSDCSSAKWRCYECRICSVEVYACRIGEGPQSTPLEREVQIVTEGILLNLELAAATLANAQLADKGSYSHAFRVDLSSCATARNDPARIRHHSAGCPPGRSADISKLLGAAGADGLKLFERLTEEVDNWFTRHLRDLALTDAGDVTKEQELSIRRKALRERDIIFAKICQENGIGGDLASLARAAETLASAINKGALFMGDGGGDGGDDEDVDDGDFEARCQNLEEFKERHGHCRVPRGWRENVDLSNWVRNLRRKKIRGTLTSEKVAKLEELGFVWRKERKDSWEEHFAQLIEFKERFGHCRVSRNWKENVKLGQWVQSLRRLKLSGRLGDDKVARLESIGFEWRLRQKDDGPGHEFRDGEQVDAYDENGGDSMEANSDEDSVTPENDSSLREARMDRWRSYAREALSPTKEQPQRAIAYYDELRMEDLPTTKSSTATTSTVTATKASTTTTTTMTTSMRNKKAKARLPRSPTFSLNDLDETLHEKYGHAKYDYDDDDDDDDEFDAALDDDDQEEDDDWEDGSRSISRTKRKRTKERSKGRHVSLDSDQRQMSTPVNKSGVRACVECGATKTPHWRRGPSDKHGDPAFLCNACGLRYYKTLQQKAAGKKKKRTSKKQKTYRGTGSQEEALSASPERKREAKTKKQKQKDRKNEEKTKVAEAVTDSDSESRDGLIVDGFVMERTRASKKQPPDGESASASHQEEATSSDHKDKVQAAGGENAQVPWLLAFKQKRKDLLTAAAARDQPTTITHEKGATATLKEDDDETFDFVD